MSDQDPGHAPHELHHTSLEDVCAHSRVHSRERVVQEHELRAALAGRQGGCVGRTGQAHARLLPPTEVHPPLANLGAVASGPVGDVSLQGTGSNHLGKRKGGVKGSQGSQRGDLVMSGEE